MLTVQRGNALVPILDRGRQPLLVLCPPLCFARVELIAQRLLTRVVRGAHLGQALFVLLQARRLAHLVLAPHRDQQCFALRSRRRSLFVGLCAQRRKLGIRLAAPFDQLLLDLRARDGTSLLGLRPQGSLAAIEIGAQRGFAFGSARLPLLLALGQVGLMQSIAFLQHFLERDGDRIGHSAAGGHRTCLHFRTSLRCTRFPEGQVHAPFDNPADEESHDQPEHERHDGRSLHEAPLLRCTGWPGTDVTTDSAWPSRMRRAEHYTSGLNQDFAPGKFQSLARQLHCRAKPPQSTCGGNCGK